MEDFSEIVVDQGKPSRLGGYVVRSEPIFKKFGKEEAAGTLVIDSLFGNHDQFLVKRSEHVIDGLKMVAVDLYYVLLDNENMPMVEKMFFSATTYDGVEVLSIVDDPNADEPEDNWIPGEYLGAPELVMAAILTKAEGKYDRIIEIEEEMAASPHSWLHSIGDFDSEDS